MGRLSSVLLRFLPRWLRSQSNGRSELESIAALDATAAIDFLADPQTVAIGLNQLKSKANKVPLARARVFEPDLENGRYELSTFCVDELNEDERWELLGLHVRPQVVARAELTTAAIRNAGLTPDPDWDPERHVNVIGWPDDEAEQKIIAQTSLANMQKFSLRQVA